jgi:hypothetical protein
MICPGATLTWGEVLHRRQIASCLDQDTQAVEAALMGLIAYTGAVATAVCPVSAAPCIDVEEQALIYTFLGAKASMDHEWRFSGLWCPAGCPTGIWSKVCRTRTSDVLADVYDSKSCNGTFSRCGPACP